MYRRIQNRNLYNLKIYEIGSIYLNSRKSKTKKFPYLETIHVAAIFSGYKYKKHYSKKNENFNYYDLKGLLNNLLYSLGFLNSYLKKNLFI